jgi:hypothetical protein
MDIQLDDARLAEIEAAARKAAPAIWHQNSPPTHEVYGVTEEGDFGPEYNTVALTIQPTAAAHIVATQPRVALAMVAEILRLRKRVEVLERAVTAGIESEARRGYLECLDCDYRNDDEKCSAIAGCCTMRNIGGSKTESILRAALDAAEEAK